MAFVRGAKKKPGPWTGAGSQLSRLRGGPKSRAAICGPGASNSPTTASLLLGGSLGRGRRSRIGDRSARGRGASRSAALPLVAQTGEEVLQAALALRAARGGLTHRSRSTDRGRSTGRRTRRGTAALEVASARIARQKRSAEEGCQSQGQQMSSHGVLR